VFADHRNQRPLPWPDQALATSAMPTLVPAFPRCAYGVQVKPTPPASGFHAPFAVQDFTPDPERSRLGIALLARSKSERTESASD
jgi:hypothetical protein